MSPDDPQQSPPTPPPGKEPPSSIDVDFGAEDDAVIGRALRWSLLVAGAIGLVVAGVVAWNKWAPRPTKTHLTEITPPQIPDRPVAEAPQVTFTDITREAGIDFVRENGATGEKLLPETMGGGVAFLDYDNDGDQDLFFVNGNTWPWADTTPAGNTRPVQALYANDGTGRFTNVTARAGLDVSLQGMGVAVGDYDNDGFIDLFISAVGRNRLFHNQGDGMFREVTEEAGVGGSDQEWSTSCGWADIDNDGDLDLIVANYVRWSREIDFEVGYKIDGTTRAYGQPMNFEGTFPYLYRNEGNGRFSDISKASGLQIRDSNMSRPMAKSLGVAPVDLDGDGWMDFIIANDTVHNFLFHNQGDGTFQEIGALSGIAFDSYGNTRGAMGIDTAQFRNDRAVGISIGNFANEMTALYVSQNDPLIFTDEAITEGIGPASRLLLTFGIFFFDYDLDGRLDLLAANGHLEEEISKVQASQHYTQPAQLFWNRGAERGPSFLAVGPEKAGQDLFKPIVGRGSAFADIEGDGDLDVVLTQSAGPPLLLRNDQSLGHHWLRLKLVGSRANRDAIGARVRVNLGDRHMTRRVMPTRSYLSQSELPVTLGLETLDEPLTAEILWPDGQKQRLSGIEPDQFLVVTQP